MGTEPAAGATGVCAGAAPAAAHAKEAKKRLGMKGRKKEMDTGHPACMIVNSTVNRAEPKRKPTRGAALLVLFRLCHYPCLGYDYIIPGVDNG